MTKLPSKPNDTVDLIYKSYEDAQLSEDAFREHLGASIIGDECNRKLWYSFHGCKRPSFSGRTLRLFKRGQDEEQTFIDELRSIGCTVHTVDQGTGKQYRVSACNGHFGGSMDGVLIGLPEAPARWHVCEFKTHNDKSFKTLCKQGVEKSKPVHYAQMQCYMHLTGMKRALYLAVNKNDDNLYAERVHYHKEDAEKLIAKAQLIIDSPEPLERLSEDKEFYLCKWCDYREICHGKELPLANCRTCAHSTAVANGKWACEQHGEIPFSKQLAGCDDHLYQPELMTWGKMVESDGKEYVKYVMEDGREFYNVIENFSGKMSPSYSSFDLHGFNPDFIGNPDIEEIRDVFGKIELTG